MPNNAVATVDLLKEPSGEGTDQLKSLPGLPWYALPRLVQNGLESKKEFPNSETWSFLYLFDMVATV